MDDKEFSLKGQVALVTSATTPPSSTQDSGSRSEPPRSLLQIKELPPGAAWTGFDRGIGASAYFGPVSDEAERRAA